MQLELRPFDIFTVDSVSSIGTRLTNENDFSIHNNNSGIILMFSMTGGKIEESSSKELKDNSLLEVHLKLKTNRIAYKEV